MAYEFKLPDLGEGLTEGEIARWLVQEGQEIAEDDPLVEIATDKTTVEIPSPAAGVVTRILVGEGEVVPVGTVLVVIGGNGAEPQAQAVPGTVARSGRPPSEKVRATPLVRRLAEELGVDLAAIAGTGPQGRITEADVRSGGGTARADGEGRREPIRGIKRQMFEHLARAHREIPPVTWVEECDFTDVDTQAAAAARAEGGRGVAAGVPRAERAHRGRRARLSRPLRPRRRGADRAGARRAGRARLRLTLARRARCRGQASRRSGAGGHAHAGGAARRDVHRHERRASRPGLFTTPLINHPQVAILGVYRIADRPVVRDGEVVVRRIGNVSVTFDHRVIDGKRAADFGLAVIARLRRSG